MEITPLLGKGLLVVLGLGLGYAIRIWFAKQSHTSLERKLHDEREAAKLEVKHIVASAKEEAVSVLADAQKEQREQKQELRRLEERLLHKEDTIEKERTLVNEESRRLQKETEHIRTREEEIKAIQEKALHELERVAGLGRDEAKTRLFQEIEQSHRDELAQTLARLEREKEDHIEAKSVEVITSAIQRYARQHIGDITTSVVSLPDEELKGKIIGREGRNIRAFERLTGVEVIVDEIPEGILLSSFDPLRRELAKVALEKLIKDGRIQPAKIEEKVEEARVELDERIRKIGEDAAYEVGVLDLPKDLLHLLGKLNFRTSYGQNVLTHSIEMAHISGMIAGELHLNVMVAKKGALLHDIGKALTHEIEGTHVELGRKLLKKYGIDDAIIHAMESHHEDYPFSTPESFVVTAADVISAARPGARRDTLEKYIKRLEDIEKAVQSFEGVKQAYAVSAGREVRVFVVPEKIDDFGAFQLAKQIAGKIQSDVQYPGEIKVTVIREVRAIEYAR